MKKILIVVMGVIVLVGLCLILAGPKKTDIQLGGTIFPLKEDLPMPTQNEIDRILDLPVASRTASESAWLVARGDYLYNEVVFRNADDDIIQALGRVVPTGTTGFAKGAIFSLEDKATGLRGLYENIGTKTDSVWEAIGLQQASVTLSSTSFSTISTTPVTLIPDPGDGYVISLVSVTGFRVFASESWTGVDEGLEIKFEDENGPAVVASFSVGFSEGDATSPFETLVPIGVVASPSEPLVLTASSSHSIDGDTYFKFKAFYHIWDY